MTVASSGATAPVNPERLQFVDKARRHWIARLVDLSRRNNLLYFRDLKVGTLDLSGIDLAVMKKLLQSGSADQGVAFTELFGAGDRKREAASLKEIGGRARMNFEERGLDTLFLAMGLATWTAEDGGRDPCAPVVLIPIEIVQKGTRPEQWRLRRAGEVRISDVLLHALTTEHGVNVDADALKQELLGDDEGEDFNPEPLFARLRDAANRIPGFGIEPRWILGNFAFQKMAIVRDLKELLDALGAHDLIAGLSGDRAAEAQARGDRVGVEPREFDGQPPDAEFLIRDADSSQQQAIAATLRGQNGVISGPPGTGKSQTISNLIAELIARGKSVLFVAEKRAALDVVLSRLQDARLGHLCLDCHGADISRKLIAAQLQTSLELVRSAPLPDTAETHRKFVERRERLNSHVRAMHVPRPPAGAGLQALYGALLRLPAEAHSTVRFTGPTLKKLTSDVVKTASERLIELGTMSDLVLGTSSSPWLGAELSTEADAREAVERCRRLAHDTLPALRAVLDRLFVAVSEPVPRSIATLREPMRLIDEAAALSATSDCALFAANLTELSESLRPAQSFFSRLLAQLTSSRYRAAVKTVRGWHSGKPLSGRQALDAIVRAQTFLERWRRSFQTAVPAQFAEWTAASSPWAEVLKDVGALQKVLPQRNFEDLDVPSLIEMLAALGRDTVTPGKVRRIGEIRRELEALNLNALLLEIQQRKAPAAGWPDLLRYAWLQSCIDDAQLSDTSIATFDGRRHDEIVREFRELDELRIRLAVQRVWRAHAQAAVEARNRHPEQSALVQREAQKKARHMPLRRLFTEAPDVLMALRPCWMASPLSVSQLLPGDKPYFDVVIFDEASQVLPEDAVTSLLRGRQAVVAGDQRQLPPTAFFAAGTEEQDEDQDDTAGFQSILDQLTAFLDPPWSLDWHYRSRDEALISYSNHQIYGGRLVTFPGASATPALRHELVSHVPGAGQEQSASREVTRVVELIMEHARTRPHESLGVIAMGIAHANRIEAELYRVRELNPELEGFFAVDRRERFFVKNLERVQGDERDAIILSVGYGKNEAGQVLYRFGPLLQEGGERRLNVAITRARNRMTVVSSFTHADLDPAYPKAGVRHLRAYLEYAASGGRTLGQGALTDVPLNDFEQSVHDELKRHGINLIGQVGSSRYRIDLAAVHPDKPGRYVLAIECDGATYHSAPTARDRDRLRQQQLEALGWRFCRIWSTDWFVRRDDEIRRVVRAYEDAVRAADLAGAEDGADNDGDGVEAPAAASRAQSVDWTRPPAARGPRPHVRPGLSIDEYTPRDLVQMVDWVCSDGRLHTDEEILNEVVVALGFRRRGSKIIGRIRQAIASRG